MWNCLNLGSKSHSLIVCLQPSVPCIFIKNTYCCSLNLINSWPTILQNTKLWVILRGVNIFLRQGFDHLNVFFFFLVVSVPCWVMDVFKELHIGLIWKQSLRMSSLSNEVCMSLRDRLVSDLIQLQTTAAMAQTFLYCICSDFFLWSNFYYPLHFSTDTQMYFTEALSGE